MALVSQLRELSYYVPTRGRVHWEKLPTLEDIKAARLLHMVTIVCPKEEVAIWQIRYPDVKDVLGRPDSVKNLSQCRAWMVETCPTRYIFLLDDDVTFRVQYEEDRRTARVLKDIPRFKWGLTHHVMDLFQEYPHVGFGGYYFCHRRPMLKEIGWAGYTWGYDRDVVGELVAPALRRLPLYSDSEQCLTILRAGFKNVVTGYVVVSARKPALTPQDGGCGVYRTPELVEEARQGLIAVHGDFIRERPLSKYQRNPQGTLYFDWKRAYESGVKWRQAQERSHV